MVEGRSGGGRGIGDDGKFEADVAKDLEYTEDTARAAGAVDPDSIEGRSWHRAREVVAGFKPVPSVIWRLSNYVFGRSGEVRPISEGFVFGLKKFLLAIASDPVLGAGEPVNDARRALSVVASDTLAAGAVIHAISRRLKGKKFERIWRPILDDALLRANIGFMVGERCAVFGSGRGMLAGFAGRSGLAVLIASGSTEEARKALEGLATGEDIALVGLKIYGCNPLQVSAMLLSASGVGKDAAFGSVSYALRDRAPDALSNPEQERWLAAFTITELIRMNQPEAVPAERWRVLNLGDERDQKDLIERVKPLLRRGHRWGWME